MEEEEPSKRPAALVSLLRRFSKERITKVAAFLLSSCPPIPAGKDAKQDAKPEQNLRRPKPMRGMGRHGWLSHSFS